MGQYLPGKAGVNVFFASHLTQVLRAVIFRSQHKPNKTKVI